MDVVARISGVLVIIAILGIFWWYSRKYQSFAVGPLKFSFSKPRQSTSEVLPLSVVARSRITATHELHLIDALGQYILICTSPSGAAVLSTRDRKDGNQGLPV